MTELNDPPSNVTVLVWLSSLFDLPKDKVNTLVEAYSELNTLNNFDLLNAPTSETKIAEISNMNSNENVSNRISSNVMDKSLHNSKKFVDGDQFSYSSVGAIPRLTARRQHNSWSSGNANGVFRAFSHPSSKLYGSGSMHENLGTFHQSYINTCKTFNLTEDEVFSNLYVYSLPIAVLKDSITKKLSIRLKI